MKLATKKDMKNLENNTEVEGISAKQAWEMLQNQPNTLLIDVRSSMEFLFVGHPDGAVHIPWVDEPDWEVNPQFVAEVERHIEKTMVTRQKNDHANVILLCRSGDRSVKAGERLIDSGINNVLHIEEGFEGDLDENEQRSSVNGWRLSGLPWKQC